jgi:hypothetical protein
VGFTYFREREAASLAGRQTVADLLGGGQLDERSDLGVQLLLALIPVDDPRDDRRQPMDDRHAPSSTPAMANETRSQRRFC